MIIRGCEEHRMHIAMLCLALVLVAATSTHVAAVELVNPLQVLERSRRAGIEFDQRMKRDAAEQKKRENEQKAQRDKQKAQRDKQEKEQKVQQEAQRKSAEAEQRKRERDQKAEADAQRKRETRVAKGKAGSQPSAKVTPAQSPSGQPAPMTAPAQPMTNGSALGEQSNELTN